MSVLLELTDRRLLLPVEPRRFQIESAPESAATEVLRDDIRRAVKFGQPLPVHGRLQTEPGQDFKGQSAKHDQPDGNDARGHGHAGHQVERAADVLGRVALGEGEIVDDLRSDPRRT